MKTVRWFAGAAAVMAVLQTAAYADSMRCGTRTVVTGDTKEELVMKCGAPDGSEVPSTERRRTISGGKYAESTRKVERLYSSAPKKQDPPLSEAAPHPGSKPQGELILLKD